MVDELTQAFQAAREDADIRAAVLTGSDGTFCAGGDLKGMEERNASAMEARQQLPDPTGASAASGSMTELAEGGDRTGRRRGHGGGGLASLPLPTGPLPKGGRRWHARGNGRPRPPQIAPFLAARIGPREAALAPFGLRLDAEAAFASVWCTRSPRPRRAPCKRRSRDQPGVRCCPEAMAETKMLVRGSLRRPGTRRWTRPPTLCHGAGRGRQGGIRAFIEAQPAWAAKIEKAIAMEREAFGGIPTP